MEAPTVADNLLASASYVNTLWSLIIRPPRVEYSHEELMAEYPESFEVSGQLVHRTDFVIMNDRGLELACTLFEPASKEVDESDDHACVVFCHKAYSCRMSGFELVPVFLPLNIGLLCFDFAGSGISGGDYVSLGHFEQSDLASVIGHLRQEHGFSRVGVWGQCMGAAAAIMYSSSDPSLAGMVLDSPFCDLWELMSELSTRFVGLPSLLTSVALRVVRAIVQQKAGFDICDVSPRASIARSFVPMLFLHGGEDEFALPSHSVALAQASQGETQRLVMPGLGHHTARPDGFVARAAVFLVRALRWEDHLPPGVPDMLSRFVDEHKSEMLASPPSVSAASKQLLHRPSRVDDQSQAEKLTETLTTICFGTSKPPMLLNGGYSSDKYVNEARSRSSSPTRRGDLHVCPVSTEALHQACATMTHSIQSNARPGDIGVGSCELWDPISWQNAMEKLTMPKEHGTSRFSPPSPTQATSRNTSVGKQPSTQETSAKKGAGKGSAPLRSGAKENVGAQKGVGKGAGSKVQPRKPEVVPKAPLKKLFWSPIIGSCRTECSVWEKIHKDGARFDQDELELLFAQKSKGMVEGTRPRIQKRCLLSDPRRRQIWCMLALMPEVPLLLQAIISMDISLLGHDKIELLLGNLPSPAEEALVLSEAAKEADGTDNWDRPENFILKLVSIPEYSFRIKVWAFLSSLEETTKGFVSASTEATLAAECLQGSERIEKLLAVILGVGNYLNGGTQRGRADGFDLDILGKLSELKASQQGNLLDFIVGQVEKDAPGMLRDMFGPGMEYDNVHRVRRLDMIEMRDEAVQVRARAEDFLLKLEERPTESQDSLARLTKPMACEVDRLQNVAAQFEAWETRYNELCAWFGMDANRPKASHEFFGLWDAFLSDLEKALTVYEHNRHTRSSTSAVSVPAGRRPRSKAPCNRRSRESSGKATSGGA